MALVLDQMSTAQIGTGWKEWMKGRFSVAQALLVNLALWLFNEFAIMNSRSCIPRELLYLRL
jgi:hypothetical protein